MKKIYILPTASIIVMPELMQTFATSNTGTGGASGGRAKQFNDIIVDDEEELTTDEQGSGLVDITEPVTLTTGKRFLITSDFIPRGKTEHLFLLHSAERCSKPLLARKWRQ